MPRYIDAEKICVLMDAWLDQYQANLDYAAGVQKAKKMIEVMPTADVQEVQHSVWIVCDDNKYFCQNCGRSVYTEDDVKLCFPFCHCGARMDGVAE